MVIMRSKRWLRKAAGRWRPVGPGDLVRVLLAHLLLIAAGLKCYQLATSPATGDGFLDSRWVLIVTVEFELLLGLWLLGNIWPRWTHGIVLLCFCTFAAISLHKALSGAASCGCFGRIEVNPWYTFTLDVTAVMALLRWGPSHSDTKLSSSHNVLSRARYVTLLWLCLGIPAAVCMGMYQPTVLAVEGVISGNGNLVVLEPRKWVGQPMPLMRFLEEPGDAPRPDRVPLHDRLAKGKWLVLLYHHDCPKCQDEMPRYEELARRSLATQDEPRVALIEIPPYGERPHLGLSTQTPWVAGRLSNAREWFVQTPVDMLLEQGRVLQVGASNGEVP